jgi:hypothetical protein
MTDSLLIAAASIACSVTLALDSVRHTRAYQPSRRQCAAIRREVEAAARRILGGR